MKKTIALVGLGVALLFSCGQERAAEVVNNATQQKPSKAEIAEQIDDSITIKDAQGSMKLTIRGKSMDKSVVIDGGRGTFQATQTSPEKVEGVMTAQGGSYSFRFGFAPKLGFQSLDSKSVDVMMTINDGGIETEVPLQKGKVSLTRAKLGDFLVGSFTGIAVIKGENHSVLSEFQVPFMTMQK